MADREQDTGDLDRQDAPQSPEGYLAAGLEALEANDPLRAVELLEAGLAAAPEDLGLRYHLGMACKEAGRPKQAMRHARELLEKDPAHREAALLVAELLQEAGFLEQAGTLLGRFVDRNPEDAVACQRLADTLRDAGHLDGALECYQRALQIDGDLADALHGRAGLLAGQGAIHHAEADYRRLLELDPGRIDARIELANLRRRFVPQWHFPMLNDTERNEAFEQAIRRAVQPDHLVLDVGCGTGLLSMMAARAGAAQVVACDVVEPIARTAEEIIEQNGFTEKIQVVPGHSTLLRVGKHLPRRADILVAEVVDAALLGEGIISVVRHARAHLLTPEARVIPAGATMVAMLVDSPLLFNENRVGTVSGFDLSRFNRFSHPASFQKRLSHYPHTPLCDPFEVFTFDFNGCPPRQQARRFHVPILRAGRCHAVVFWFTLRVDDQATIDTGPDNTTSCWMQAVQLLDGGLVAAGEALGIGVRHTECNILFERLPVTPG
ncbi:MAG: 50S ribosomal protein L11 methyltransferase [Bradymonadales bacterium]|nr:50S ribosomal protein L11 methyltransferase [Bradymonadales bacterium]